MKKFVCPRRTKAGTFFQEVPAFFAAASALDLHEKGKMPR